MNQLLLVASAILLGLVLAIIAAIVGRKVFEDREERRDEAARQRIGPAVFAFVASEGDDDGALRAAFAVRGSDHQRVRTVATDLLRGYSTDLRGEVKARIRSFLVLQGVRDAALEDLGSRRAVTRARGIAQLALVGDARDVPAVVPHLRDADETVRHVSADTLGTIGDAAAAWPLLVSRDSEHPVPYGLVSRALLELGTAAGDDLLRALDHPSFRVRRMAVDIIGELGMLVARDAIRERLRTDRDILVRIRAARALGRVGTAADLADLYASGREENAEIGQSIVRAVTEIGAVSSIAVLRRALQDPDHATARVAANGLIELGDGGRGILLAAAAGDDLAAMHAIEVLDAHGGVTAEQRARVRAWRPTVPLPTPFPTTGPTSR